MDANLPRWIFQSIASHFQSVATDLSLPFLVEGIDERSDETMHSDHVELRVTGPTVKEISRDYYDTDTVINFLFTKAMDPVDTNAYDLIQWTGAFASEMLLPIPIYKKGSGPDDDGSFISCLRISKGKKEAARIYHFGQLDKDTPVRQSEVDAVFSMDYYSDLVLTPAQLVFSVLTLNSSAEATRTREAASTITLTSNATGDIEMLRSAESTIIFTSNAEGEKVREVTTVMTLNSAAVGDISMSESVTTVMALTSNAVVNKDMLRSATSTMILTSNATTIQLLNRLATSTMSLTSDATTIRLLPRSVTSTMVLTSDATANQLLPRSATSTMVLTSDAAGTILDDVFRSTWNTSDTSAGSSNTVQVALPLVSGGTYNFTVNWGDSTDDTITAWDDAAKTHTYNSSGNYDISIEGTIEGWQFNNGGDKHKISLIESWGTLDFTSVTGAFYDCENLTINASDSPRLVSGFNNFTAFFRSCDSLIGSGSGFADWDMSSTINMSGMFDTCIVFNASIGSWNTANTSNMSQTFYECAAFNQDISSWNTANVTDMIFMFYGCTAFNQDIGSWNTANVTTMSSMFRNCTAFNQDIGSWNTANVASMAGVFWDCPAFNQDISSWNTANATTMSYMFYGCTAFNQDIGSWNTANVTTTSQMFQDATNFDQDLSGWDISSMTAATNMFNGATLSTTNYSATLIGWEAGTHCSSVTFHGGNSTYNAAGATARDALVADSWTITDGGHIDDFSSTWNTANTSGGSSNAVQVALPLVSDGSYNFVVEWGDSTDDTITAWDDAAKTHTYNSSGNYNVVISGEIQGWQFNNGGDKLKISSISNWGALNLANPSGVAEDNFYGCTNLTINATDAIDLTSVTSLDTVFRDCDSIASGGAGIDTWDTSSVNSLTAVFRDCLVFNADIGSWNTSNTTNMGETFRNCPAFNQDIGSWNTANTTNMTYMLQGTTAFNQNIGSWNTAKVTDMYRTFGDCTIFNQDISSWNTHNTANMTWMFRNCTAFNQDIGSWNTANTTNMLSMFYNAVAFDQDLSGWDISSMTNASEMLDGTTMSTTNYSALLIGWEAGTHQSSVTFHGGNATYNAAGGTARTALLGDGWTITDGGAA